MDEPPELRDNGHWRMAVWALRVGYVGLAVAVAGLIVMSLGSTPWVLAVGAIIWLAAAAVTLTGVFWSRHQLSRATTWVLVDAVHAHPRHGPRPVVGPAVLTTPPWRLRPPCRSLRSCRPGWTATWRALGTRSAGRVARRVGTISGPEVLLTASGWWAVEDLNL